VLTIETLWAAVSEPSEQGYGVAHAPLLETNVNPGGVRSETVTGPDVDGPLLVTITEYVIVWPGKALAGPLLAIDKSLEAPMATVDVALLFPAFGSVVVALTVAVFEIEPVAVDARANVVVIVALEPEVTVPIEHGNAVVHAPVLETNVMPGGVRSVTVTPVASDGPLFVTTIE
jgi:hypothetical protein